MDAVPRFRPRRPTPDENTIRLYRDKLTESGALKRVMKAFDWQLRKKGYIPPPGDCRQSPAGQRMSGQIVDASLVPAPKQRNTDGEKEAIKAGKSAKEIWPDEPNKAAQKDVSARWTLKVAAGSVSARRHAAADDRGAGLRLVVSRRWWKFEGGVISG